MFEQKHDENFSTGTSVHKKKFFFQNPPPPPSSLVVGVNKTSAKIGCHAATLTNDNLRLWVLVAVEPVRGLADVGDPELLGGHVLLELVELSLQNLNKGKQD